MIFIQNFQKQKNLICKLHKYNDLNSRNQQASLDNANRVRVLKQNRKLVQRKKLRRVDAVAPQSSLYRYEAYRPPADKSKCLIQLQVLDPRILPQKEPNQVTREALYYYQLARNSINRH